MFYEQCTRTAFLWNTSGGCFWINWSRVALFTGITKTNLANLITTGITFSWLRSLSYRNQSIDLQSKSVDWFLHDKDLHHERVNSFWLWFFPILLKNYEYLSNGGIIWVFYCRKPTHLYFKVSLFEFDLVNVSNYTDWVVLIIPNTTSWINLQMLGCWKQSAIP